MAIGAKDKIDKLLVEKYANQEVDKHIIENSSIAAEDVMKIMGYISHNSINYMNNAKKLSAVCYAINSASAKYERSRNIA